MQFTVTMTVKAKGPAKSLTERQMKALIKRLITIGREDARDTLADLPKEDWELEPQQAVNITVQSLTAVKGL